MTAVSLIFSGTNSPRNMAVHVPMASILKRAKLCYLGYFNKFFHIYARRFLHLPTSKALDEGHPKPIFSVHKEFLMGQICVEKLENECTEGADASG